MTDEEHIAPTAASAVFIPPHTHSYPCTRLYPPTLIHTPLHSFVSPHTRSYPPVCSYPLAPIHTLLCSLITTCAPLVPAHPFLQLLLQLVLALVLALLFLLPPLPLFCHHCCCCCCVYVHHLVRVSTCKIPVKTRLVFHRCNLNLPLHLSLKILAKQINCQLTYLCKCAWTHGGGESEGAHSHNWFCHSVTQ